MNTTIQTVSHYGVVRFGDLECEAVVLLNGARGWVLKQMARLLGFNEHNRSSRFASFLEEFAPEAFVNKGCAGSPILMPHGGKGLFFPSGIITEIAFNVVDAYSEGRLHKARLGMVPNCKKILRALAKTGEAALIDEATGYQFHREPDALQFLVGKYLRQESASWELRFNPDFYSALYRLFNWKYDGHVKNPPHIVGAITMKWVYGMVFPTELIEALKEKKKISDKNHQWLSETGINQLQQQISCVTMLARASSSFRDFESRCEAAFHGNALQLGLTLQ